MMSDVIVIENYVDPQCVRHVHVMSNTPIPNPSPQWGEGSVTQECGVWHFRAEYPYRGVLDVQAACPSGKFRRLVVWNLQGCDSVKDALISAGVEFERLFGARASFAFMKKLPKVVEHGQDVRDLTLLEAEWMLEKCVAVGCRGKTLTLPSP
jgi:hypothetical protein